jgi:hypothetical protein
MKNKFAISTLLSGSQTQSWFVPHRIVLIILWFVTTSAMVAMLVKGVRDTRQFSTIRYALHAAYVAVLLWYLGRTGPPVNQLPELSPQVLPRRRYGAWIPVLGILLMFTLTALSDDGVAILLLLMLVAMVWIIVAWRREISLRLIIQGIGVAAIAFFAGRPFQESGFVNKTGFYQFTLFTPTLYIAGGLLFGRTGLGGIQLLAKQYLPALRSFLWGCLLFVPLGLTNAADGAPVGSTFTWVSEWWMPFSLPWWSGIVEETWFRLLLVGLIYLLLRPAFQKRPALAILLAVLFSGITFGLVHGLTLERFLTTGLLYGVPFAILFARRDWEHAVGAHYMVNMIPWVMVFLEA